MSHVVDPHHTINAVSGEISITNDPFRKSKKKLAKQKKKLPNSTTIQSEDSNRFHCSKGFLSPALFMRQSMRSSLFTSSCAKVRTDSRLFKSIYITRWLKLPVFSRRYTAVESRRRRVLHAEITRAPRRHSSTASARPSPFEPPMKQNYSDI